MTRARVIRAPEGGAARFWESGSARPCPPSRERRHRYCAVRPSVRGRTSPSGTRGARARACAAAGSAPSSESGGRTRSTCSRWSAEGDCRDSIARQAPRLLHHPGERPVQPVTASSAISRSVSRGSTVTASACPSRVCPCFPPSYFAMRTRLVTFGNFVSEAVKQDAPTARAAGASWDASLQRCYLSVAISSRTAFTDLSIIACSSASSLNSMTFSAPPAPMTTGTPT